MPSSLAEAPDRFYRQAPCVFLDCDGVIFDSNGFKLDALRHALVGYPAEALSEMELFWSANGGMARQTKLEYFFSQLLGSNDVAAEVAAAAERFGDYARRAYDPVQPIAAALELARDAGSSRCFVVSGADQTELRDIFRAKHLSSLFAEVCGSPTAKLTHVARILQEQQCPPERAVLIGDGAGDFDVCRRLGVPFIYLHEYSEWLAAKPTLRGLPDVLVFDTWQSLLDRLGIRKSSAFVEAAS